MGLVGRISSVIVAIAAVIVLWPQALGGATAYIVVSGVSMEPTLSTGDLVLVRRHASYEIGDVAAFRTEYGDVIHRIIGGDATSGYAMQGDNKAEPDRWVPTPRQIRGSQFAHVPGLGAVVLRVTSVVPGPVLGGLAALLLVGSARHRRRRRRSATMAPMSAVPALDRGGHERIDDDQFDKEATMAISTSSTPSRRIPVAVAAGLLALLALPSAVVAWRTPTTSVVPAAASPTVEHQLSLTVTGVADAPSLIYPSGRTAPIQAASPATEPDVEPVVLGAEEGQEAGAVPASAPMFAALIDELAIDVSYELDGGTDVVGTASVDVRIQTGRGYTMNLPGIDGVPFEGAYADTMTLSLTQYGERLAEYVAAAGIASDSATVTVTPRVTVSAMTPDGPLETAVFVGDALIVSPGDDVISLDGTLRSVGDATVGSQAPGTVSATSSRVVGIELSTGLARGVATAAVVLLTLLAVWLLRREDRERPEARIRLLYRSIMVDISAQAEPRGEIVRVASMAELARLARRDHRSVLHQVRDGVHRYLVPDADLTYEYTIHAEDGVDEMPVPDDASTILLDDADQGDADHDGDTPPPTAAVEPTTSDPTRDIDADRVVVVRSFAELSRLWVTSSNPPARLERQPLMTGGTRYTLHRGTQMFVYEAAEGVDLVAAVRRRRA